MTTGAAGQRLQSGREVCPACKRKGLGYAPHPHAYGFKDYGRARCRYCHAAFKIRRTDGAESVRTAPMNSTNTGG